MKPCKFFLQGSCRNGSNCRFSHDGYRDNGARNHGNSGSFGSQTLSPFGSNNGSTSASSTQGVAMTESGRALAIEELKYPPMWSLSGFAVAKGLPSVVTGDVSPEEARWEAYQELKTLGNCMQSTQKLQALAAEQHTQRQQVISLLENYQSAQRLFAGEALLGASGLGTQSSMTNPFIQGGAASPFPAATPTASSFGTANPFNGGTTSTRSPFGGTGTTSATNSFIGGLSTTFGAPSSLGTTNGSNFTSAASSNPFGGGTASTASGFGTPATTATSPFGAPSTTSFGGIATPSTSLGGPSMTTSPFGGSTSLTTAFGSGSRQSGFGQGIPSASPFGGSAATPATSPFSNALANPGSSPFGAPASSPFDSTTATAFGEFSKSFGTSSTPASASTSFKTNALVFKAPVAPSSSPFGVQTAPASSSSGFGGTQKPVASSTAFFEKPVDIRLTKPIQLPALESTGLSPDSRDDAWNMEQFQQAEFTFGNVPTMPPPPQFC